MTRMTYYYNNKSVFVVNREMWDRSLFLCLSHSFVFVLVNLFKGDSPSLVRGIIFIQFLDRIISNMIT